MLTCFSPNPHTLQRLAKENTDQTQLIQHLMVRIDSLEDSLQNRIEDALKARRQPKGMFGGFLGPRAKGASAEPGHS